MKYVMLHRWFVVVAMIALVMTVASPALAECPCETQGSGFAGGDGTPGNPYQVCLPKHLDNVRNHLSSHFIQTADIDMSGFGNFTPIGGNDPFNPFEGSYDGNGRAIDNLSVEFPRADRVGLFGEVWFSGSLANVKLTGNVIGVLQVGCLSGLMRGSITNSTADCSVSGIDSIGVLESV